MNDFPELLVYDEPIPCPYLPGREARMPLRQPLQRLAGQHLDRRLAAGDRRTGPFLYRTQCPGCNACIPIRIPVHEFRPNRAQRRAARRADEIVTVQTRAPVVDERRVHLYNRHRRLRGLGDGQPAVTRESYELFLLSSCCESVEIDYLVDGELAAVAIADRGQRALSAVYCYYDPDLAGLSLGVYSILTQLRLAREWGMDYLYLGLYVANSPHMSYKVRYRPHELRIDGAWVAGEGAA